MNIELTEKEFRRLLDLVYVGNWVLNSARGNDRFADYDFLQEKLFALCAEHDMNALITRWYGHVFPSQAYETGGIHEAIADYEDGSGTISYLESELTGMEGTFTSIHYTPQGAHLERTGNLVSTMDFTPGVRNTFAYDTPYGSATVGLETLEYTPALSETGGTLNIVYVVDFRRPTRWSA